MRPRFFFWCLDWFGCGFEAPGCCRRFAWETAPEPPNIKAANIKPPTRGALNPWEAIGGFWSSFPKRRTPVLHVSPSKAIMLRAGFSSYSDPSKGLGSTVRIVSIVACPQLVDLLLRHVHSLDLPAARPKLAPKPAPNPLPYTP